MIRKSTLPVALVVLGVALLLTPALFPVQQMLYHESRAGTTADRAQLEEDGYDVIAYEDLSERGRELYVASLRHDGPYTVPVGEGADEFNYTARDHLRGVVIERPADSDLPPADEPVERAEFERHEAEDEEAAEGTNGTETGPTVDERRQQIARYDLLSLRVDTPPLTATPNLSRLLAALVGVVLVGVGGYLSARP